MQPFVIYVGVYASYAMIEQWKEQRPDKLAEETYTEEETEAEQTTSELNAVNDSEPTLLTEEELQIDIHRMSHQKVYADDKRGFLEITPERINDMLSYVRRD